MVSIFHRRKVFKSFRGLIFMEAHDDAYYTLYNNYAYFIFAVATKIVKTGPLENFLVYGMSTF